MLPKNYVAVGEKLFLQKRRGNLLDVQKALDELAYDFLQYYDTIYSRLEKDKFLPGIYGAVLGPMIDVTETDIRSLESIGYLNYGADDKYFAFAPSFTSYLQNHKFAFTSWEGIINVEQKIKNIVRKQLERYGVLATDKKAYEQFLRYSYRESKEGYNPFQYNGYIENNKKIYHRDSTLLEVMSLKNCFESFVYVLWEEIFKQYFANEELRIWKNRFEQCARGRNALAHGHPDYLTENESNEIKAFCQTINDQLVKSENIVDYSATDAIPKKLQDILAFGKNYVGQNSGLENEELDKYVGKVVAFKCIERTKKGGFGGEIIVEGGSLQGVIPSNCVMGTEKINDVFKVKVVDVDRQTKRLKVKVY